MSASGSVDDGQGIDRTRIEVSAHAERHAIEALYLELRELARQHGLKIEYRLTRGEPGDTPGP